MRIVFLGTGEFGVPALRALLHAGHDVACCISQPDRPAGRGRQVRPTPIHAAAEALGVPHVQADDVNAPPLAAYIAGADIGVVVAFGQRIGPGVLAAMPRGCVNIHGSLLPKYRGAAPIQRAMIEGERETGVSVFQLNERWDAGAIWGTRATPIRDDETADELHDRLALLGAALIVDTLPKIEAGTATASPQDATRATRAPKLSKAEGTVDWSASAWHVLRRIHGLWSWPAATCVLAAHGRPAERVLLVRAAVADDAAPPDDRPPGALHEDLTVQTGRGRLQLLEVQPAGRKRMAFADFARGRGLAAGDRLEPVTP